MPYCAVANCKNHSLDKNLQNQNVCYHRFPNNPSIKQKWVEATGRDDWTPLESSTICSDHFDKSAYLQEVKPGMLHENAVPTEKLSFNEDITSDSESEVSDVSDLSLDDSVKLVSRNMKEALEKAKKKIERQRLLIRKFRQQHRRDTIKIKLQNRVLNDLMEIYNLTHGDIGILRKEIMKTEEFKNSCKSIHS